jgi:hypothetical protein
MNEVSKSEFSSAIPDLASFTQASSEATRRLCEHSQSIAKTIGEWNSEINQFCSQRAARTGEAMARIAKCESFPEILSIQAQWWRDATDDYLKEASKLAELNTKIVGDVLGSVATR